MQETADKYGVDILARLPIDPAIAAACDAGKIEEITLPQIEDICQYIEKNLQ